MVCCLHVIKQHLEELTWIDFLFSWVPHTRIKVKLCLRVEDTPTSFLPLTSMLPVFVLPELILFSWVISSNTAPILPTAAFQIKDQLYFFIFLLHIYCNCTASFFPVYRLSNLILSIDTCVQTHMCNKSEMAI